MQYIVKKGSEIINNHNFQDVGPSKFYICVILIVHEHIKYQLAIPDYFSTSEQAVRKIHFMNGGNFYKD